MKITSKALKFYTKLYDEMEGQAFTIAKEFAKLVEIHYDYIKLTNINGHSVDIDLWKRPCGRGCCGAETVGHITVTPSDLQYPVLKINSMRLEWKENNKINKSTFYSW